MAAGRDASVTMVSAQAISSDGQSLLMTGSLPFTGGGYFGVANLATGAQVQVNATQDGQTLSNFTASGAGFVSPTQVAFLGFPPGEQAVGQYTLYLKDLTTGALTVMAEDVASLNVNAAGGVSYAVYTDEQVGAYYIAPGQTTPILFSTSTAGDPGDRLGGDYVGYAQTTTDGHYGFFVSSSTNLVPGDTNDANDLFRKDMFTGALVRVAEGVQGEVVVSADGSTAVILDVSEETNAPTLRVIDVATGITTTLDFDSLFFLTALTLSPDGKTLGFHGYDQAYFNYTIDLQTGRVTNLDLSQYGDTGVGTQSLFTPVLFGPNGEIIFSSTAGNLTDAYSEDFTDGVYGYRNSHIYIREPGVEGNDILRGGLGSDTLYGQGGDDLLDGGAGDDTMVGALGDDTYVVDSSDTVIEAENEGIDTVRTTLSAYTLGDNVENLIAVGASTAGRAIFTGNGLANVITGAGAQNALYGRGGDDRLMGGANADRLDGGSGADVMIGGAGNDTYIVDNLSDVVIELAGQGTDTVLSSVTFNAATADAAGIENVELTGSAASNILGNALNNQLTGNSANNGLNGGGGADVLIGLGGNDTYIVDNLGDIVVELINGGIDTVMSSVSFNATAVGALGIENITLTGSATANVLGNNLNNILIGNAANNSLNGGRGADTMSGGLGNDTYTVDSTLDVVTELAGQGTDYVRSTISYTLGANLENLTLQGSSGINGIGNELANTLIGNTGNNILAGKGGADILTGGGGSDTFDYNSVSESSYSAYDRITDLGNDDRIDLSGIDANTLISGNQAFSLVNAFTKQAGQITLAYNASAGFTVLSADVNGDGKADMRIVINGDHHDFTNFVF